MKIRLLICFLLSIPSFLYCSTDWMTFGLYKAQYSGYRSTLFNPNQIAVKRLHWTSWPHGSFFQLIKLQTQWFSLDWQIDLLGKAVYDNEWKTTLNFNQLFIQKDFLENGLLVAGRSIQRWGTGYAFNPSDVVGPEKNLSDPENSERQAQGLDMVKLEWFGSSYSFALCGLAQLRWKSSLRFNDSKLALRFYTTLWNVDLSLVSCFQKERTPIWGSNFSFVVGDRLEVHGEASVQRGSRLFYHRILSEPNQLYDCAPFVDNRRHQKKHYPKILLGFQMTLPLQVLWVSEYFYQSQGYSKAEWKRIVSFADYLGSQLDSIQGPFAEGNLLWNLNVFSSQGAMQNYWMNHAEFSFLKSFRFSATVLSNITDGSFVAIPQLDLAGKHFTLFFRSTIFQGHDQSEYGALFQSCTLEGGIRF